MERKTATRTIQRATKTISAPLHRTRGRLKNERRREKGKRKNYHADNLAGDKTISAPLNRTARTVKEKEKNTDSLDDKIFSSLRQVTGNWKRKRKNVWHWREKDGRLSRRVQIFIDRWRGKARAITMCMCHSGGSVLHCSFSFIISFGHVGQDAAS